MPGGTVRALAPVAALALLFCAPVAPAGAGRAAEVTVALFVPLSGPAAAVGQAIQRGVDLAQWEEGAVIRVVTVDAAQPWSSGLRALAEIRYAEGVQVVIAGATAEDAHLAAQFIARERGDVLLLIPWASDPALTRIPLPWLFRVAPDEVQQRAGVSRWSLPAARDVPEVTRRFAAAYGRAFGEPPPAAAAYAYDAVSLLAGAVRRAGADPARLRQALADTDHQGVTGRIQFDASGQRRAEPVPGHEMAGLNQTEAR